MSTETANGVIDSDSLTTEINDSAIATALSYIATDISGDSCDVFFVSALSGGDQTILDGILSAHTGTAAIRPASTLDTFKFAVIGRPRVENDPDGAWIAPKDGYLAGVTLYRGTAGSSGSTTIDVNKNGTTLFTNQNIRPSVSSTDGNNAHMEEAPDVTTFVKGDRFQMDIDAIEAGTPLNIVVIVEIQYT
jgi:hypothetical protein